MKSFVVLVSLLYCYSCIGACQSNNDPSLGINDIEQGFIKIDHLRAILLENGFKFNQKEDGNHPEVWVLYAYGSQVHDNEGINISIIHDLRTPGIDLITITITKEIFPDFAINFLNSVKKSYPTKKLRPDHVFENEKWVEKGYIIEYTCKGSKISVIYSQHFPPSGNTEYSFAFWFQRVTH